MIFDGRKTPFEIRETAAGFEIDIQPLIHPSTQGVDIQIVYALSDLILRIDAEFQRGVRITITPGAGVQEG